LILFLGVAIIVGSGVGSSSGIGSAVIPSVHWDLVGNVCGSCGGGLFVGVGSGSSRTSGVNNLLSADSASSVDYLLSSDSTSSVDYLLLCGSSSSGVGDWGGGVDDLLGGLLNCVASGGVLGSLVGNLVSLVSHSIEGLVRIVDNLSE